MDALVIIHTFGGLILRAPVSRIITGETSLWADWDMRHNLIHNPRFPYVVRPADIKAIEYV